MYCGSKVTESMHDAFITLGSIVGLRPQTITSSL